MPSVRLARAALACVTLAALSGATGCQSKPDTLYAAVMRGSVEDVRGHLAAGADPDAPGGEHGALPLHIAAQKDDAEIAEVLLEHGAFVDRPGPAGITPLHVAARSGRLNVARILIRHGANVDAKVNRTLVTPLHFAAIRGHAGLATLLIQHDAVVDARNVRGATPLHFAAMSGNVKVARVLLGYKADAHARTESGMTPRDVAVSKEAPPEMLELLPTTE